MPDFMQSLQGLLGGIGDAIGSDAQMWKNAMIQQQNAANVLGQYTTDYWVGSGTTTATTANTVEYYQQPVPKITFAKPVDPNDPVVWLRRRVNEVLWEPR